MTFATNQLVVKTQFVSRKIRTQCASVHPDIEAIQSRKLDASRPMHVPNVRRLPYAKLHQLEIKFANAHKDILAIQNRLDVSQSANVKAIQIVPTVLGAKMDAALISVMISVVQT